MKTRLPTDSFKFLSLGALAVALFALPAAAANPLPGLADGFANPPASARPHVWWHWMNGNVTKEGITADLEALAEAGIAGATLFASVSDVTGALVV